MSRGTERSFCRYSKTFDLGYGIGYCDPIEEQKICGGDSHFCEDFDVLEGSHLKPAGTCPLFRQPELLGIRKGIGYCDIDSSSTACEGVVESCEKPEACPEIILRGGNPGFPHLESSGR